MKERKEGQGGERIGGERIYVRVDICIEREKERQKERKKRDVCIYIYKVYIRHICIVYERSTA
jgi:hypothetical protein